MKKLAIIALFMLTLSPTLVAGELVEGLSDSYWQDANEFKKVLVVLTDQVNVRALTHEFKAARLPLSERHRALLDSLKARADRNQAGIQKSLDILVNNGMVRAPQSHWLVNMIVCEATKSGAELLANITDVAEVGAAEVILARTLIETEPAEAALLNVEAPLRTIRAPEAWAKGFYGTGTNHLSSGSVGTVGSSRVRSALERQNRSC